MAETENNETEETPAAAEAKAEETAPEAPAPAEPAAPREPPEIVAPKERRRRARASKAAQSKARKPLARRVERPRTREKARAAVSGTVTEDQLAREHGPGRQKTRQGVVVSDKADKTITVRIDTARRHRRYEKIVRTSNTLHAHDETNDAHIGDTVIVREARPLSRTKRWRLIRVVERAE